MTLNSGFYWPCDEKKEKRKEGISLRIISIVVVGSPLAEIKLVSRFLGRIFRSRGESAFSQIARNSLSLVCSSKRGLPLRPRA